jgi:SAM-dependent methyltransferase
VNQGSADNLSVTVGNGYTFDDGRVYDVVVASEVFEHVLEPSRLAENITRRMAEGSYVVVTTPNGYGPWELKNRIDPCTYLRRWNSLRRLLGKTPYIKGGGVDHCQFYTKGRLLELFSSASLELVDSGKSDSFLTVFTPLRRNALLGRLDTRLADILPYWMASGWYFVFQLRRSS